ncbi:MAG: cysteine hydrolase family protein [Syntrophobacteraceae bacterium]
MKPALIVVDLLRDTFQNHPRSAIVEAARAFRPRLNALIDTFHQCGLPVVFACDSFMAQDFIFKGKMKPHSLRGTPGADVWEELNREPQDLLLPKRRFSSFFKTDLDVTLRTLQADTVLVTGIATPICVLTTALDAVSHDFRAVIVEDCCAAHRPQDHEAILNGYRKTPLYPLLQVLTSEELSLTIRNN